MIRVRFAPSPTGPLHVGGARTALFNYLLAHSIAANASSTQTTGATGGGRFILRIDDTDVERSKAEHEQDIYAGLRWLGLSWDEGPDVGGPYGPYRQRDRKDIHLAAAERLVESKCAVREADGAVRLRYPDREVVVNDIVCGRCVFNPASLGPEPILVRSDGNPTYHLASVSDDIEMRISHVVRGQDHLTNTAKHVLLFEGLGVTPPFFAHLPLILGSDGSKLSKRNTDTVTSVADFRHAGYLPEALANFLFLLGWSHPEAQEILSLPEAVAAFQLERVGKTASVFERAKLDWLNGQWIRRVAPSDLSQAMLEYVGDFEPTISRLSSDSWLKVVALIQGEIHSLLDVPKYLALIYEEGLRLSDAAKAKIEDESGRREVLELATAWQALLKESPTPEDSENYDKESYSKLLAQVKKTVSLQGKSLFTALRVVITGDVTGPDLQNIVILIPRHVLVERASELVKKLAAS